MSAPIFISCSSQDRKAAETICKAVEQRGLQCWISSRNIGPGENFQELITRAIRSAKLMILVFSANANNSLEVKKEIALAGRYNVVVVPVRVEDVVPNDALSYELAVRQWIDMFDNWEDAIERLVLQLSAVIQADAAAAPGAKGAAIASATAPAAPPQPETPHPSAAAAERGRPSVLPLIAAAVVVILITLAGAGWFFWPMSRNRTAEQAPTATNPAQPAAAPPTAAVPPGAPAPLRETLSAHVAAALPRLSQNIREDLARDYVTATGHKALAGPLNAEGHWRSFDRRTPGSPEMARSKGVRCNTASPAHCWPSMTRSSRSRRAANWQVGTCRAPIMPANSIRHRSRAYIFLVSAPMSPATGPQRPPRPPPITPFGAGFSR